MIKGWIFQQVHILISGVQHDFCNLITLVKNNNEVIFQTLLPYYLITMKIEYNNLYTHFILITQNRYPLITERQRERIEKYWLYRIAVLSKDIMFHIIAQTPKGWHYYRKYNSCVDQTPKGWHYYRKYNSCVAQNPEGVTLL